MGNLHNRMFGYSHCTAVLAVWGVKCNLPRSACLGILVHLYF